MKTDLFYLNIVCLQSLINFTYGTLVQLKEIVSP